MKIDYIEEEQRAVEEILTKPVFIGFSEETIRVRRNLLTIAFLTVFYNFSGIAITGFSFLGIIFSKIPDKEFLDTTIFLLLLYHFVRFIWQSLDAFQECKIRITGTNALFMRNDNKKENSEDYTIDPRQSSLLNWLWKRTKPANNNLIQIESKACDFIKFAGSDAYQITQDLYNMKALMEVLDSNRTFVSLRRFENFYKCFSYSQILRWLVLEFGLPVVLTLIAMCQTYQPCLLGHLNFPCL